MTGRLVEELEEAGAVPPQWREAFRAVPRHLFIPEVIWVEDEEGWRPLSRADDPDGWWREVDSDGYVVTQVDDGREPVPGALGECSTSSASQPSLVLRMLHELGAEPGMRVLEIGTGTGYNAALLAARLGTGGVTSVEVDPQVAQRARRALAEAGCPVDVITADGFEGHPPGAPYDRIIATASVRRIPPAWLRQTRPGGVIVTPFGNAYHNDALLRLAVGADGTASGPFTGPAAFMWMRQDRVHLGRLCDHVHPGDAPDVSATGLDPREMFGRPGPDFAISVQVPDVSWHRFDASDGSGEFTIWLFDVTGERSWASVDFEGRAAHRVEQYGPRRLWDEVEAAYRHWLAHGRPDMTRYGLTVAPDGRQHIWLDSPDHRVAPVPGCE